MSVRTVFLARLFGLYCIVIAAIMLPQPEAFVTIVHAFVADAPLVLIAGIFTLSAALLWSCCTTIGREAHFPSS